MEGVKIRNDLPLDWKRRRRHKELREKAKAQVSSRVIHLIVVQHSFENRRIEQVAQKEVIEPIWRAANEANRLVDVCYLVPVEDCCSSDGGTNDIGQHVTVLENRLFVFRVECFFHVFRLRQQDLILANIFTRNEKNTGLIDVSDALPFWRRTLGDAFAHLAERLFHPPLAALGEELGRASC